MKFHDLFRDHRIAIRWALKALGVDNSKDLGLDELTEYLVQMSGRLDIQSTDLKGLRRRFDIAIDIAINPAIDLTIRLGIVLEWVGCRLSSCLLCNSDPFPVGADQIANFGMAQYHKVLYDVSRGRPVLLLDHRKDLARPYQVVGDIGVRLKGGHLGRVVDSVVHEIVL